MGRRARGHTSIRFILVTDDEGQVSKRFELDTNGKLLHPLNKYDVVPLSPPQVPLPASTTTESSVQSQIRYKFPIPPKMREKPSLYLFGAMNGVTSQAIPEPPASTEPSTNYEGVALNVVDIRSQRNVSLIY